MKKSFKHMLSMELGKNLRQIIMACALVLICLVFSFLTEGTFTSPRNLSTLMLQAVPVGISAISIVLILVAGHMDLSIGSFVGLMGSFSAVLMVNKGIPVVPAIALVLVIAALIGAWEGAWVAFASIPAFIVTLSDMLIMRGFTLIVSNSKTISPMPDSFQAIGQGYIPGIIFKEKGFVDTALIIGIFVCIVYIFSAIKDVNSRKKYGLEVPAKWFTITKIVIMCTVIMGVFSIFARHLGIPIAVALMGVLALVFSFICKNTAFGRYVYAIGGNKDAATLSGINVKLTTFSIFVIMGVMNAISSIVYTARNNSATLSAGTNMEMDVIAAAIIGGTSTMGGEGSVLGAIIGALIMASIDNGMSIMNLQPEVQYVAKGMILLLAVWMDIATRKNNK